MDEVQQLQAKVQSLETEISQLQQQAQFSANVAFKFSEWIKAHGGDPVAIQEA